ncbi:hypothetical protein [uncultured Jatrophihabitans sp.]|uniref:hypothetical protein n=1 Tax=uncultured Jatrophihabitans sp. TaxID=1610747 RepID=UPI0035C9A15C
MSMRHTDTSAVPAASPNDEHDTFGTIALAAAVISFVGFAVLVIGHQVDPADFNNGKHPSPANNVAFFAYVIGVLVALVLGGAVWFYGRRSGRTGPRSRAALATYYGAVFLVVAVIAAALGV